MEQICTSNKPTATRTCWVILISESLLFQCGSQDPTILSFTTCTVRIFSGDHATGSIQSNIKPPLTTKLWKALDFLYVKSQEGKYNPKQQRIHVGCKSVSVGGRAVMGFKKMPSSELRYFIRKHLRVLSESNIQWCFRKAVQRSGQQHWFQRQSLN